VKMRLMQRSVQMNVERCVRLVQKPKPPRRWLVLCRSWEFSDKQARQSWAALYRAQWATASDWRMRLLHFEVSIPALGSRDYIYAFLAHNAMPETIVNVFEALVEEGLLTRREAGPMEEAILDHVGSDGDWALPKEEKVG
jgi:hypothetical protein